VQLQHCHLLAAEHDVEYILDVHTQELVREGDVHQHEFAGAVLPNSEGHVVVAESDLAPEVESLAVNLDFLPLLAFVLDHELLVTCQHDLVVVE